MIGIALALAGIAAAAPGQPLRISTSGWCSPVFVNVKGPVTVTCNGVDPQALAALNRQLDELKVDNQEKVQRANEWADRYRILLKKLKEESDGSEIARQAEQDLRQGNLDDAIALLKQLTAGKDKQNIDTAARDNYEAGLALEMEFKTPEALDYLEEARRLRPNEPEYELEYARALLSENRFDEAKAIYDHLLPKLAQMEKSDVKYAQVHMFANIDAGHLYTQMGDLDKGRDAFNQAFASCVALSLLPQGAMCDLVILTDILLRLGEVQLRLQRYSEAEAVFTQAFNTYKGASQDGSAYRREQAQTLSLLGYAYSQDNNPAEAERVLTTAYQIQFWLLDQKNPGIASETAQTALFLASLKSDQNRQDEAESYYGQAANTLRTLAQQDPDAYMPSLERALYEWGRTDLSAKALDKAAPVYEELLPIDLKMSAANPAEYLSNLATTYNSLALIRRAASKDEESLAFRRQCADTYRKMDPSPANRAAVAITLNALAWDEGDLQRYDDAQKDILEGEQILRDLNTSNPGAYGDRLAQNLVFQGMLLRVTKKDCAAVRAKLDEARQFSQSESIIGAADVLATNCQPKTP